MQWKWVINVNGSRLCYFVMNPEICFPKPSFIPSSLSSLRMIYRAKMVCHIHFFSCVAFLLHNITQTTFPTESSINRSLWIAIKHSLQRVLLSQGLSEGKTHSSWAFLLCFFFGWRNSSEAALMLKLFTTNKHAEGEDCTFPKEVSSRRHTRVLLQLWWEGKEGFLCAMSLTPTH